MATTDAYIVWAEDGESDAVHGDNRKENKYLMSPLMYSPDRVRPDYRTAPASLNDCGIPELYPSNTRMIQAIFITNI